MQHPEDDDAIMERWEAQWDHDAAVAAEVTEHITNQWQSDYGHCFPDLLSAPADGEAAASEQEVATLCADAGEVITLHMLHRRQPAPAGMYDGKGNLHVATALATMHNEDCRQLMDAGLKKFAHVARNTIEELNHTELVFTSFQPAAAAAAATSSGAEPPPVDAWCVSTDEGEGRWG